MRDQLPLVIACAPAVEPAIADRRFERWALPEVERLRRLDVVMAVEQQGVGFGILLDFADDHRLSRRLENLGWDAEVSEDPRQEPRALFDTFVLGADAGLADEGLERLERLLPVGVDVVVDAVCRHPAPDATSTIESRDNSW